jgi:ubiquinone/menaquinone biosynthesis C-methylase UbiE
MDPKTVRIALAFMDQECSMGFYSRLIFPWLCDMTLGQPFVAKHRQDLLCAAGGEILEIGFGTGLNLPHYPDHIRRITAVDPNPGMHRRAEKRIAASQIEVEKHVGRTEQLPFGDASFDCVVSTFTLCSVEDERRAMSEVYRILRPGGSFLFLEHGICPEPDVQKWQRRLNWLQRTFGGNCHLDRKIRFIIAEQPFESLAANEFYLEQTPRTHGYIYQGLATK